MKKTYFAPTTTLYNVKAQTALLAGTQIMDGDATEDGGPKDGTGNGLAAEYEFLEDYEDY